MKKELPLEKTLMALSADLVCINLKYDQEIKHPLTIYVLRLKFKAQWLL